MDEGDEDNQTVYFRKAFRLESAPSDISLYVTADNYYTAYVNGHEVGKSAPLKGDDFLWAQVKRYDVSPYLNKGQMSSP